MKILKIQVKKMLTLESIIDYAISKYMYIRNYNVIKSHVLSYIFILISPAASDRQTECFICHKKYKHDD